MALEGTTGSNISQFVPVKPNKEKKDMKRKVTLCTYAAYMLVVRLFTQNINGRCLSFEKYPVFSMTANDTVKVNQIVQDTYFKKRIRFARYFEDDTLHFKSWNK